MENKQQALQYAKDLRYLPKFMSDFHDQKDLFKTIHELYGENEGLKSLPSSWRDHHIWTIDYFLYFMAVHGFKLQKVVNTGIDFYDLSETISEFGQKRLQRMSVILKSAEEKKP